MVKARRMRWAGHVEENAYVLVRKPEGNRLLGIPNRRYEDNIKVLKRTASVV
jgi:hypothetical protein